MLAADVVGDLAGIFEVDGVLAHADGKRADGLFQQLGRNGAHERAVQSAAEQEADRRVGVQPLLDACDQPPPDAGAQILYVVCAVFGHGGQIGVAREMAVAVIVSGREGDDALREADQVFGFAGEHDFAAGQIAVKQRTDADGIAGRDQSAGAAVIEHHGELGVQHAEHFKAVFAVERQQNLAV